MFNVQVILPYVGFGLLGLFVLIGGGIIFAIYRDRKKNATLKEASPDNNSNKGSGKTSGKTSGKEETLNKKTKPSGSGGMFSRKPKPGKDEVVFSVGKGAVDASTISDQLAEGRVARHLSTRNRMSSPDDLIIPDKEPGNVDPRPAQKPFVPFTTTATEPTPDTDIIIPVAEPVAEEVFTTPPTSPTVEQKPFNNTIPKLPPAPGRFTPPTTSLPRPGTGTSPTTEGEEKVSVKPTSKGLPGLPPPPVVKSAPVDRDRAILVNKPDYLKHPQPPKP